MLCLLLAKSVCRRSSKSSPRKSQRSKTQPFGAKRSNAARLKSASRTLTRSHPRTPCTVYGSRFAWLGFVTRRAQVDYVRALEALHLGAPCEDTALLEADRSTRDVA